MLHVTAEEEGLAARPEGRRRFQLVYLGGTICGASSDSSVRGTFDRAPDERVTGSTVLQRDQTYKGPWRP